jgi:hypothetical protein
MANITATTADAFIPEIWANSALEVLRNNTVLAGIVTKDTDVAAFGVGDVLHVPYPGSFSVNDKAAGSNVTTQTPTGTDTTVTLNKHKEVSFIVEDFARAVANQDIMARYVEAATIALAEQIETDLAALVASATTSVGTTATDITAATIRAARKALNDAKAPQAGRALVVSPKDEIALLGDSALATYFAYAQTGALQNGQIGRLYGFDIFMSQLVNKVSTTTHNPAFSPGAIILAMRGLPDAPAGSGAVSASLRDPQSGLVIRSTVSYNPSALGAQVTLDALYGVKILRDAKLVDVKS